MCGRVMVMAIVMINVPMCHSFLIRLVARGGEQGRGDGPSLINMGEIPSANKGNVRFLIRPTCLKAALVWRTEIHDFCSVTALQSSRDSNENGMLGL